MPSHVLHLVLFLAFVSWIGSVPMRYMRGEQCDDKFLCTFNPNIYTDAYRKCLLYANSREFLLHCTSLSVLRVSFKLSLPYSPADDNDNTQIGDKSPLRWFEITRIRLFTILYQLLQRANQSVAEHKSSHVKMKVSCCSALSIVFRTSSQLEVH